MGQLAAADAQSAVRRIAVPVDQSDIDYWCNNKLSVMAKDRSYGNVVGFRQWRLDDGTDENEFLIKWLKSGKETWGKEGVDFTFAGKAVEMWTAVAARFPLIKFRRGVLQIPKNLTKKQKKQLGIIQ